MKDILTGIDGESYDSGRVMSLASFIAYFGLALGNLIAHHPWGAMDFAGGCSTMAVGFGVHLKLKADTEPPQSGG